jgi:hypothetical protein
MNSLADPASFGLYSSTMKYRDDVLGASSQLSGYEPDPHTYKKFVIDVSFR